MRLAVPAAFLAGVAVAVLPAWLVQRNQEPPLRSAEVETIVAGYLREHPDVIIDAIRSYQARAEQAQRQGMQDVVRARWDEISRQPDDPVLGNPQGDVTLVEFFDYRCGYCKRAFPDIVALKEHDPQLRIVLKEFPILGPESVIAAQASLAARQQGKYAELHEALMQVQGQLDEARIMSVAEQVGLDLDRLRRDMDSPEVEAVLQRNFALAEELGIRGTPAFLTRNRIIPGAVGVEALKSMIAEARQKPS